MKSKSLVIILMFVAVLVFVPTSSAFAQTGLPSPITDLSATAGDGEVTLTWTRILLNGGTFVNYDIIYGDASETVSNYRTTSITIPDLNNGENYTFTVKTVTSEGSSLQSNAVSVTPIGPKLPSPITDLSATAGDGEVTLTWTRILLNGGTFVNYDIIYGDASETVSNYRTTSITIPDLNNGENYTFTVKTVTSEGSSLQSNAVSVTPIGPKLPSPITDLSATAGDGEVTLTWTRIFLNGGTFVNYDIIYGDASETSSNYRTTSITIPDLNNGENYTFTVKTVTSEGSSLQSNAVTVTPVGLPSQITDLSATAGDGEITLSWTAPNLNGGTFMNYEIINVEVGTSIIILDRSITSETITLSNDVRYDFIIRTVTSSGTSLSSDTVSVTPFAQTDDGTTATVNVVSPPTAPNFTLAFERISVDSSFDLSTRGIVDDTDTFEDLEILICNISSPVNTISGLSASGIKKLEEFNCREVTDKNALVFKLVATNGIPKTVTYIVTDSDNLSSKGNITFAIVEESDDPPTAPNISFTLEAEMEYVIDFIKAGISDDNTEALDLIVTLTDFDSVFDTYVEFLSGINESSNVVTDVNKQVTIGSTSSAVPGFRSQDITYTVTDNQGQSSTGTISFDISSAKAMVSGTTVTEALPYGLVNHTVAVSSGDYFTVSPAAYQTSLVIGLNTTAATTEGGTVELVNGASGKIETITYTPPQQNFVGTDQIILKGSVTVSGVTTSAESTLNFVVSAPQCISQVGNSISFGEQIGGQTSGEQRLDIANTGNISSSIFLKGTDWVDDADRSVIDVGQTRYSGTEASDFTSKTQLSNSNVSFDDNLESSTTGTAYLQLLADLLVTGFTGEATQTITVVTSCDL